MSRSPFQSSRPLIVGVLNLTPDSFSDGGAYPTPADAIEAARAMLAAGADIIDIGGESTRPGSLSVPPHEQLDRVLPVIAALRGGDAPAPVMSIDTTSATVAAAALDAGAAIVNDTSAATDDEAMLGLVAERGASIILMHRLAPPRVMQDDPRYGDVVDDVLAYLTDRAAAAEAAGVARDRIAIDPGIGFGKTTAHNLALIGALRRFVDTGYAVMLGASRKRFLGELAGIDRPNDRDGVSAVVTALAVEAGVRLHRVHDVARHRRAADAAAAAASRGAGVA